MAPYRTTRDIDVLIEPTLAREFQGVPTRFASLDDLVAMKEATGRPEKNLPDLRRLRELQQRRRSR